jgi:hypothetical protein
MVSSKKTTPSKSPISPVESTYKQPPLSTLVSSASFMPQTKAYPKNHLFRILLPNIQAQEHSRPLPLIRLLNHKPIHLLKALCLIEPIP